MYTRPWVPSPEPQRRKERRKGKERGGEKERRGEEERYSKIDALYDV
jgi:hypothetical protein